jgi:hypothetical protein
MYVAYKFYWSEKNKRSTRKGVKVSKSAEARAEKAQSYDFEASSSHNDFIS